MRVSIGSAGHTVEIQTDEPDMDSKTLVDLAVDALERTTREALLETFGASGCGTERGSQRIGFTWNLGAGDRLNPR